MRGLSQEHIDSYQVDGAVLIKGLLSDWVDVISAGIERNLAHPSQYAAENLKEGESGRFFDDYCNWSRIPEFEHVIRNSDIGEIAAGLMQSDTAKVFHDHVLVKEPGTSKPTPWHQDSPYYFVDGDQCVSFWCPVDAVSEATLRCVAGSHKWKKPVLPVRWLANDDFYPDTAIYQSVPDPEANGMRILQWDLQPGDAVAFHFKTLHGAKGNDSDSRRRAFSLRMIGDDARYVSRPGQTSPPFPGHGMDDGDILREDWFPTIYKR